MRVRTLEPEKPDPMTDDNAITLAWTSTPEPSQEWVRFLLAPIVGREHFVGRPHQAAPNTLYVINTDKLPFEQMPASFFDSARNTPAVGLLVPNDEWYSGNYDRYRDFSFVLRFYHAGKFNNSGILTLPLGYARSQPIRETFKTASERAYLWAFMGKLVGSRHEMLQQLSSIEPNFTLNKIMDGGTTLKQLSKTEYHDVLADSVFAPAPMGNVALESYRLYEALENGAVPLVERRWSRDYFRDLFGDHPIPTFRTWAAAAAFVNERRGDEQRLDTLQHEVTSWWRAQKQELQERVAAFVRRGMNEELRASLRSFVVPRRHWQRKVLQGVELLRHHSPSAARRRATMSLHRLLSTGTLISAKRRAMTERYEELEKSRRLSQGDARTDV